MTNTAVTVIDAPCGAGKSTFAINYLNEAHSKNINDQFDGLPGDRRFIVVAPLLVEADRFTTACPDLRFKNPQPLQGRKLWGLRQLIERGENVATTHALFSMLSTDIYELLKQQNYELIVDEALTCVELFKDLRGPDKRLLFEHQYVIVGERDRLLWNEGRYPDYSDPKLRFADVRSLCLNGNLSAYSRNGADPTVLMWTFPADFIRCFQRVHLLTYLFHGSPMSNYIKSEGVPFDMKTIVNHELVDWAGGNEAQFKARIRPLISIYEGTANNVGKPQLGGPGRPADPLSKSWFKRARPEVLKAIKSSTENFFKKIAQASSKDTSWTTYKDFENRLRGARYGTRPLKDKDERLARDTEGNIVEPGSFISLGTKAVNHFRGKTAIAYLASNHMDPDVVGFFKRRGVIVNENAYALSEIVQLVWRTAIRDFKPISIYVPSQRMRGLLQAWLASDDASELIDQLAEPGL